MPQLIHIEKTFAAEAKELLDLLKSIRRIDFCAERQSSSLSSSPKGLLSQICSLEALLRDSGCTREAQSFNEVYEQFATSEHNIDTTLMPSSSTKASDEGEIMFALQAHLMSLNSADRAYVPRRLVSQHSGSARPMTLSEKILLHHSAQPLASIGPGDVITIHVDWILASELSWHGMSSVYDQLLESSPSSETKSASKIFRNDRFWLAGDHLVTTHNKSAPPYSDFVFSAEKAHRNFHMTEYQGMNYTIMHTEFVRARALPGQLTIGSDSHTCSAGALGSLALGLGTSDVVMPLITGQTWIRVPECIKIDFTGRPPVGMGGKDVILHILGELGRNTVAKERIVEFGGDGAKHLSTDARFAICNMCAEFGAVTGLFVPDGQTTEYVQGRKRRRDREGGIYFKPDKNAKYAQVFEIDLNNVKSTIARYPKPDDVVPVREMAGLQLDGCFIGACTTAQEDLVLAALALEAGLNSGLTPLSHGKRKVVPGSIPVRAKLDELNLTEIYRRAGFEVGEPSCSYCVGLSEDKAADGEVWMSSQNRNFENRMGPGAIGHITSALVVAASSFNMVVTDPNDLVRKIPAERLEKMGLSDYVLSNTFEPTYMEPSLVDGKGQTQDETDQNTPTTESELANESSVADSAIRKARVQVLPSFVDTDALAPNESLATCHTPSEFAQYCLKYTHPSFRDRAQKGENIIVAGEAFGCGSSREVAVTALQGCGIQAIIAQSFSFIFGRNAANLGLLCITLDRESGFYDAVADGQNVEVEVDMNESVLRVHHDDGTKVFPFELSDMEKQLVEHGGMIDLWKLYGAELWNNMMSGSASSQVASASSRLPSLENSAKGAGKQELAW